MKFYRRATPSGSITITTNYDEYKLHLMELGEKAPKIMSKAIARIMKKEARKTKDRLKRLPQAGAGSALAKLSDSLTVDEVVHQSKNEGGAMFYSDPFPYGLRGSRGGYLASIYETGKKAYTYNFPGAKANRSGNKHVGFKGKGMYKDSPANNAAMSDINIGWLVQGKMHPGFVETKWLSETYRRVYSSDSGGKLRDEILSDIKKEYETWVNSPMRF